MPTTGTLEILEKCLTLLRRVQFSPFVTVKSLAHDLGRSEKQVRRYLDAMSRAGFDFVTDEHGNFQRQVRLRGPEKGLPLELLTLTRPELTQLYLGLAGIYHGGDPAVRERVFTKVAQAMPRESFDRDALSGMLMDFDKAYKSYESKAARHVLAELLEALYRNHSCRCTYRRPHEPEPRTFKIEPYQLFEFDGGLYCYCRIPRFNSLRMLAVERIQALEMNDEPFRRDSTLLARIAAQKAEAFRIIHDGPPLRVHLRFSASQAPYVLERVWHPSQSFRRYRDGSLSMRFCASGRLEITRWILSWGAGCEVLSPRSLRREVAAQLRAAHQAYR